jgi:glycosidase
LVGSAAPTTRCADVVAGPFGSERWTKIEAAGMYYFHQFYPRQPDLNFENPEVQEELLNVLRYWMDRGIDGFRFDVPDRYFEEENSCAHNQATIDFHARMRETISGTGTLKRGFVGEIWGMHHEVKPFFGPSGNPMIFSFNMMFALYSVALGLGPEPVSVLVDEMLRDLPAESRWGIFTGNHDTPRFADVAAGNRTRLQLGAALVLTMPGVPYIWMGDELGLHAGSDFNVDWRDGTRTPYPWDDSAGFGFTTGDEPHLDYAPDSGPKSFARQRAEEGSLLNYYRTLIGVRNGSPALQSGTYALVHVDDALWVFDRVAPEDIVRVIHNLAHTEAKAWPLNRDAVDLVSGVEYEAGEPLWVAPGGTAILRDAD